MTNDIDEVEENIFNMNKVDKKKFIDNKDREKSKRKSSMFGTVCFDKNDLIEVRPNEEYLKKKEEEKNANNNNDDAFNGFDIFDSAMLNNKRNEYLELDYLEMQRKLRDYSAARYKDDIIFNYNKSFFNQFI